MSRDRFSTSNLRSLGAHETTVSDVARRLVLAAWILLSCAQIANSSEACLDGKADGSGAILVRVSDVRSGSGNVAAVLYGANPLDFLKKGRKLARVRVPARKGRVEVCLAVPRPGIYAIAVYHDENDNKKFDRSWIGLPLEDYGFSNNPTLILGPPTHEDAAFEMVGERKTVDIDLQN